MNGAHMRRFLRHRLLWTLGVAAPILLSSWWLERRAFCYTLPEVGQVHYCLATASMSQSSCLSILDLDYKHFCLAHVTHEVQHCEGIQGVLLREQCLGQRSFGSPVNH